MPTVQFRVFKLCLAATIAKHKTLGFLKQKQ
jgi:hypothetical protein